MSLQSPRSLPPPIPSVLPLQEHISDHDENLPTCVRCKDAITSGHAYELGDDRWHTHCFTCYRCEKSLSCDSDFLVLGTGALICFDCSDSCKKCGKKIDDLAIILPSSNEAYCSDCFVCCKCGDNIKDLRYARTRKGLFCLKCHKKLLAKRKYYEEKKRRQEKNLPMPPEATKEKDEQGIMNDLNDFNPDSPIPEIQESSPAKSVTSPIRRISMHSPIMKEKASHNLQNGLTKPVTINNIQSPKPKQLLNKTPLKNLERRKPPSEYDFNNHDQLNHKKVSSVPTIDSTDTPPTLAPAKRVLQDQPMMGSHSKTHSDFTDTIRSSISSMIENDTNTFTRTPNEFLNIPTTTTFNNLTEQLNIQKNSNSNDPSSSNVVDTIPQTHNDTQDENTTMSETNDILNNYLDKSSLVNDSSVVSINQDKIKNSALILKQLQEDIQGLQANKSDLMESIEDMILVKKDLEQQLNDLKQKIMNSKQTLTEQNQQIPLVPSQQPIQPQVIGTPYDAFSAESSPVRNVATASIARPATKPKFWKLFSSKQAQLPSSSSPIRHSGSNQNIPGLRNMQPPISFGNNNSHSRSSSPHSKVEISQPMLQNPEEFSDIKLFPISHNTDLNKSLSFSNNMNIISELVNNDIPPLVTSCIEFIESDEENLKSEGLYRKSGSKRVIEDIEAQFQNGNTNIDLSIYDIHAVTSVLKRYFRNLSNPIITYEIYEPIIDYVRQYNFILNDNDGINGFINILNRLPKEHIEILKILGKHISLVQQYSQFNLMNFKNLSLVFTPSLIKDYTGQKDIIDLRERNFVISYILENYEELFD